MSIREISFPSANGRDTIKAWRYSPLGEPRAIIQLVHGYGEHSRRYLHMINKFNQAGFVVFADDHLGHGKTGYDSGTLGDPHSGGYMTYLKDEKSLHDIAVAEYPDIPYMMFGHSWGSMLARGYAAHYGSDIRALMLCGLCSQWK
ncbi:MAG: alpha/beta hydrolase, partial [Gemmiger sp.]